MTITDVRIYECEMQRETNEKVAQEKPEESEENAEAKGDSNQGESSLINGLGSPKSPSSGGWFSWS